MSQPKRYVVTYDDGFVAWEYREAIESDKWENIWIKESDYSALVQQGIRDHQDWRSKLNFLEADYKAEVARLTAENERLRKAGDAMYGVLAGAYFGWVSGDAKAFDELPHISAWNAAKEGRDAK